MATIEELESLRWDLRRDCVDIIMAGAGGHIGGGDAFGDDGDGERGGGGGALDVDAGVAIGK